VRHAKGKYFLVLLVAGLSSGALTPAPLPAPLELEEYLEADDWFQAGLAMNSAGRYQAAAEAFEKSIAIAPNNALAWLNLGTAQALLGDYARAIVNLRNSVRMDPKLALGYANLAEVCFREQRFAEAIEAYTSLLTLWPDNANALYKRGLAHLSLNEAGKAQAEYLTLKMLDPDLADKLLQAIQQSAGP
jgi:tetratricopeptide (TPR) repeat protein